MIGNEPNGCRPGEDHPLSVKEQGWDIPACLEDLRLCTGAIRTEVPGPAVTAPGAYAPDRWEAVASSDLEDVVLAAHQCPLTSCEGARPRQTPTMDSLVGTHTLVCSSGVRDDQGTAFAPRANHLALALLGRRSRAPHRAPMC